MGCEEEGGRVSHTSTGKEKEETGCLKCKKDTNYKQVSFCLPGSSLRQGWGGGGGQHCQEVLHYSKVRKKQGGGGAVNKECSTV